MNSVLDSGNSIASGRSGFPSKQAATFEALFFREMQQVTTRIHETDNLDQLMMEVNAEICKLFNADRITLYAVNAEGNAINTKIKIGLNATRDLKLPISAQSLAGFAAWSKRMLNIADVYDDEALRRIHPALHFLKEVDKRSGFRTKQMMVMPIVNGADLYGVLQVINNKDDRPFGDLEFEGAGKLCKTLATAFRQRINRAPTEHKRKATRYDGLLREQLVSEADLMACEYAARTDATSMEQLLLARHNVTLAQIGDSLAHFFGVAYQPLDPARQRDEALHSKLKRDFVEEQRWVPLEELLGGGMSVLCLDPESVQASRVLNQVFPKIAKFNYRVTTDTEFAQTIDQLYGLNAVSGSINQMLADLSPAEEDDASESTLEDAAAENELVKFVNKVITDAYNQRASDIHIEPLPGKEKTGIRFRIDGSLIPYIEVPAHFRQAMATRLKIMCDLDISEKRKPQDGKIKFKKYGGLDIELRVATIPTSGSVEDVVMRILAAGEPIPLDKLGLTPTNKTRLEKTVTKPYGLFYVCGPTGSGKTTTLHSILKFLNTSDTKIWTAEDPVEITQKGLRQVQINKKAGIDFALIMRAFLRADPDIIMVGESRDKETVSMGVEASLTGHLVFSTLHTNSAPESITRLLDMGMDPFNFADALLGILAQRLAKRLCDCKQKYLPDHQELKTFIAEYSDELRNTTAWKKDPGGEAQNLFNQWMHDYGQADQLYFYKAVGCDRCNKTGYKGRLGLHELLIADDTAKKLIQERARVAELFAASVEAGMRTLKMDGMEKILMGLTDLKQVRSVCIK